MYLTRSHPNGVYYDEDKGVYKTVNQDQKIKELLNEIADCRDSMHVRSERINSLTKLCDDLYLANQKHVMDKDNKKQSLKNLIGYFYSRKRYVNKSI